VAHRGIVGNETQSNGTVLTRCELTREATDWQGGAQSGNGKASNAALRNGKARHRMATARHRNAAQRPGKASAMIGNGIV